MSASANAVEEGRSARDHALQIEKAMQSSAGAADAGLKEAEAEEESEELEDEDLESSEDVEGFSKAATEVGDDVKEGRTPDGALLLAWPPSVCCRVVGCREDMWLAGDYHRKHRVCKLHAAAEKVFVNQQEQRFCQQCSRFHTLAEFDEGKRSCRKRLAYHNERRRRHQSDSVMKFIEDACHLKGGNTRKSDFTGEQKGKRVKSACEVSSPPACTSVRQNNENTVKAEQVLPTETFSLPKTLKSKYSKNDDEGQNIRSKPHKESDKNWFLPGRLDQHSSDDGIPEATPNVSPIFSQSEVESKVYGAGGNTYVPQYGSSVRVGIELGDGIVLPPLAIKREGKLILLREWPAERGGSGTLAEADREDEHGFRLRKDGCNKKDWQKGDEETLFHCLWDCPKVQPVWKWAGRALSKIRGRKVSLEWKQAVLGERLGCWALPETISVWKLLRGIILGQVWHARKGKVYSAKQWTPGQIIRSTWVDLMMYAMQEWLEVLKTKGSLKQEEAQLLCTRFDKKWLVNGFVGRRTDWSMAWKDSYEVLLE